jgi:dienelactone hydrolase
MRYFSVLAVCLFLGEPARGADDAVPTYPDHSNLLVYRDAVGREHAVQTPGDWAIRRLHILAGMEAAMGALPDRSKLPPSEVRVQERSQQDGFVRLKIAYRAYARELVPAYLLLPDGLAPGRRAPAMLALQPTGPPSRGVVGMGNFPNAAYGKELAQRGYVVLAPDYAPFGEYAPGGDYTRFSFRGERYASGTMKGIFNHMRGVDLLVARSDVDPERIGVIGVSLGGHNSIFVGAFDERLKVIVSSCGWTPFHDYYGGNLKGWTQDCYIPRIRDLYGADPNRVPFDFYEVVAALAPRWFLSISPRQDSNFEVSGVQKAVAKVRPVFRLLGSADRFAVMYPDHGHDFPPDDRRAAYAFLDRALRHKPPREVP